MTLKRSISQRFKNTVDKTKRIVSSPAFNAAARSFSSNSSTSSASPVSATDNVSVHSAPSTQIRNHISTPQDNNTPLLLYSSKLRPSSIRRHSSQHKQLLDLDTSLPPTTSTSTSTSTSNQLPTPLSPSHNISTNDTTNTAETTFDSSLTDLNPCERDLVINNSHNQPILLPTDPVDKSIPPFTPDQLTPILLSSSLDNSFEKPSISHLNSSSSYTATESSTNTTLPSSSPIGLSSVLSKNDNILSNQIVQTHANPLFTKAHQIDHLDKNLDIRKNDQLADQMALNILQNISEESIDELSKLRDEIKMVF